MTLVALSVAGRVKEQGREQWGEREARWEGAHQGRPERQSEEGGRRGPAWMSDAESSADGLSLAERRRREFEAERKSMQVGIKEASLTPLAHVQGGQSTACLNLGALKACLAPDRHFSA